MRTDNRKKRQGQQQAVLAVANVYMPAQNNGNLEKYKDEVEEMTGMIGEWVGDATKKGYNVLVMGDLNVALSERDRSSGKLSRLDKWTGPKVEAWGLTDIWRYKHPKKAGHTWQGSYEERKISSRIDYALCDAELLPFITGIRVDTKKKDRRNRP